MRCEIEIMADKYMYVIAIYNPFSAQKIIRYSNRSIEYLNFEYPSFQYLWINTLGMLGDSNDKKGSNSCHTQALTTQFVETEDCARTWNVR